MLLVCGAIEGYNPRERGFAQQLSPSQIAARESQLDGSECHPEALQGWRTEATTFGQRSTGFVVATRPGRSVIEMAALILPGPAQILAFRRGPEMG